MRRIRNKTVAECPCEFALRYIGGAWKILILWHLAHAAPRRHVEMRRLLRGVTAKVLTQQLREMEQDGLVLRTVYASVPPKVEYRLSAFGDTLRPVIDAMYEWGKEHRGVASGKPGGTGQSNSVFKGRASKLT
jgi:DNA-binding HxlR family transcriptional regulator